MTYRALPVVELLKGLAIGPRGLCRIHRHRQVLDRQCRCPAAAYASRQRGRRPSWPSRRPTAPWPAIPDHGKETAGPFFLVWQDARRGEISSEYWVYKLASLRSPTARYKRWPALNVAEDLPATHPARRGLDRYVTLCISCHRFNGAGEGEMGPDLAKPMNPVDYFQPDAFRKFLRSSKSVRDWPERKMPSFIEDVLSNEDMEALIAWLTYKARQ